MEKPSPGPTTNTKDNRQQSALSLEAEDGYWRGRFKAMASPCELFIETEDRQLAGRLLQAAADETWRIEQKFSRYSENNIIHQINNSQGRAVAVDDEVAHLLDFAQQCWELSDGMFDVTSGILRHVWRFDGGSVIPDEKAVQALLPLIGWQHVDWSRPCFSLPEGMEIDFGGIGKEYAVDRVLLLLQRLCDVKLLLNFGGDINTNGRSGGDGAWSIGIEDPNQPDTATALLKISQGALATSGDARRFLLHEGRRYGHVLNPQTGWPVEDAPRSVTVAASTCTEAGILATLALLQGENAEDFLHQQRAKFWLHH